MSMCLIIVFIQQPKSETTNSVHGAACRRQEQTQAGRINSQKQHKKVRLSFLKFSLRSVMAEKLQCTNCYRHNLTRIQHDVTKIQQNVSKIQQDVTKIQQDLISIQQDLINTQQFATRIQQDVAGDQPDNMNPSAVDTSKLTSF